jgi:hypothetical protein
MGTFHAAARNVPSVIRRTQLVYRCDHRTCVLGRNLRVNAVTEIEDMAVASAVAGQHPTHLFTDASRRGI